MDMNEIFKYLVIAWQEICKRKFKALLMVTLISFTIMAIGIFKPAVFRSEVTIYADTQNVIKPLLGEQTSVTNVKQNRTNQVRDIIYSPRQLSKVINRIYGEERFLNADLREQKFSDLRKQLQVEGLTGNYIKISYEDNDADMTFRLLNEVVLLFVEDSANTKRAESRSAFNFIEQQVKTYKEQLLLAEERLKLFKSTHLDGTESEVEERISRLRTDIEDLKIQEMESITRINSLKEQLRSQDKYASTDYEAAIYHTRLKELQQHLDNLLLIYKDNYPEVIDARYQINDIKNTIANLSTKETSSQDISGEFNPLYKEISSNLSAAQVEHTTLKNRLFAFQRLLKEAYERRKRIANNQAELSELNRDTEVVKALYEDMLANKEKARLSMVLDIEGQGVNYKIQEPANYPTVPSGPRFLHFVIAGPTIGLLLLMKLFIVKIIFDDKVRFASQLSSFAEAPLLVSINHTVNQSERNRQRLQNMALTFSLLLALSLYMASALTYKYGESTLQLFTPLYSRFMELFS